MASAIFRLGRLDGIDRPAIGALFPTKDPGQPVLVLDVGANMDCKPTYLHQFALLGNIYSRDVLQVIQPRIGLLNIGEESCKGNDLSLQTYELLSKESRFNFAGNCEGRDVLSGEFDVVVCDGFSGNIMLKTAEGTAKLCSEYLKQVFNSSILGKISFAIGRSSFIGLRKKLDPRKHNGAVLLGLNGIVVKSHGGADSISFAHAVDLATEMSVGNYNDLIKKELNNLKSMH